MPAPAPRSRLTKRRILWSAAAVIGLLLAWQVYDILTGKPEPKVDYATPFYELCASAQPEGENAWPLLVEVLERVAVATSQLAQNPDATQRFTDGTSIPGSFSDLTYLPVTSRKVRPHRAALAELEADGTFDLLAQIASMPRCVRPPVTGAPFYERHREQIWNDMGAHRHLARLQAARLTVAAYDGRWNEYIVVADQALAGCRFLDLQPSLIEHLVAVACIDLLLGEIRTTLVERSLKEDIARELLMVLDRRLGLPPPEHVLNGERLLYLDQLQHTYTSSGRLPISSFGQFTAQANNPLAPPGGAAAGMSPRDAAAEISAILIPGRAGAERLYEEYFDEALRLTRMSGDPRDAGNWQTWSTTLPLYQIVVRATTFDPGAIAASWQNIHHSIAATRLMLGLEIFIKRHGRAPESLDDLVPDCLPEIPVDPLNGKGWGYRLRGPSASIADYDLWSFGRDGEDNNCYEGDGTVSLRHAPGTDIWINEPRHIPEGLVW